MVTSYTVSLLVVERYSLVIEMDLPAVLVDLLQVEGSVAVYSHEILDAVVDIGMLLLGGQCITTSSHFFLQTGVDPVEFAVLS